MRWWRARGARVAHIYGAAAAPRTSPLDSAPLDRAADVLRLARMGNGESRRMWNSWVAENPSTAGLVVKWVNQEDAGKAAATAAVDAMLARAEQATPALVTKGKKAGATCLHCGGRVKAKHRHCPWCGNLVADAAMLAAEPDGSGDTVKAGKARKRARQVAKSQQAALVKRAAAETAADFPAPDIHHWDPAVREAAWKAQRAR